MKKSQPTVADPECARGGGVSHILVEKRGVSFTLFKKMLENSIFSPITGGGVRRVHPMLDPPLTKGFFQFEIIINVLVSSFYCKCDASLSKEMPECTKLHLIY